jgi:hypothetical protein
LNSIHDKQRYHNRAASKVYKQTEQMEKKRKIESREKEKAKDAVPMKNELQSLTKNQLITILEKLHKTSPQVAKKIEELVSEASTGKSIH